MALSTSNPIVRHPRVRVLLAVAALTVSGGALAALAVSAPTSVRGEDTSGAGEDGPYVFFASDGGYLGKSVVSVDGRVEKQERVFSAEAPAFELRIPGAARALRVELRPPEDDASWKFAATPRIFAVSDIEGNADALVSLLIAGGVVDSQLEWKFGDGRVVFVGDLFDRGLHVTECLWLLYELEARARRAGGAVHFVLGNHEVMNLTGDFRYVRNKYHENAKVLGSNLRELYSWRTVLGRWLRTRPALLRIGDDLFVHGGVSRRVADSKLQPEELNRVLHDALRSDDWPARASDALELVVGSPDGLVWFRGYVKDPLVSPEDVAHALDTFGVKRVIVGHSLVPQIGFRFDRRVLAIDVLHAGGSSEAALAVDGVWRRLSKDGKTKDL